jgi:hypothetical protein
MSKSGHSKLIQNYEESLAANQRLQQQVQKQNRQIAELEASLPPHLGAIPRRL